MNTEMFWSCVGAILFCSSMRYCLVLVLVGLDKLLNSALSQRDGEQ